MTRKTLLALAASTSLTACSCNKQEEPLLWHPTLDAEIGASVSAYAVSPTGARWAAVDADLVRIGADGSSTDAGLPALPAGTVTLIIAPDDDTLLARVHGKGLLRHVLGSDSWTPAEDGLDAPLLGLINPTARPIPVAAEVVDGSIWLAAGGGLFRSDDTGQSWEPISVSSSGNVNLAFTDIAVDGDTVLAVSMLPESLIPTNYQGILAGRVFLSTDGGESFEDFGEDFASNHATTAALAPDGTAYVGTMDDGVLVHRDGDWVEVGGPTDVVEVAWVNDGLTIGSATRGVFRLDGEEWSHAGDSPVLAMHGAETMTEDGRLYGLEEGAGDPPPAHAGGTVHVALSFHGNYYHSYRGDSPTDDGYGQDIRVIRSTLDWLDAYPELRADWDFDNYWTTDLWMPQDSPDVLARIRARVAAGTDDVRLMSWNNGAMASSTREEFGASVERAKVSNTEAFGEFVPGVQPQECMFTPEHLSWYPEHGIDWITLFYAGNGFTALREDVTLVGRELYSPATLVDPVTDAEMTWVPAYHHADLIDHGGLVGWVRQISAQHAGDTLLLVHFDADAETWEHFDIELADAVLEPNLEWTNIADYLADHDPVARVEFLGDVADGTGDGFRSWGEKDFNHTLFTEVAAARRTAELARFLAGGDSGVESLLDDALEPRLLALSTTNYGLAMPYLHEDRYLAAEAQVSDAIALADQAYTAASALDPVSPGTLEIVNARPVAGPALLRFELAIPTADYAGPERVWIREGTTAMPRSVRHLRTEVDVEIVEVAMVHTVQALAISTLNWSYEQTESTASAGLAPSDAPDSGAVEAPFTECADRAAEGTRLSAEPSGADDARAWREETWLLDACDGNGDLTRRFEHWEGLPGTVVEVHANMGEATDPMDLQSVALTPLGCEQLSSVSWLTFGGRVNTRPARSPVESWNGQSIDGVMGIDCASEELVVAHDTTLRTSLASAPLRNEGGEAVVAVLGTLHGDAPWHEPRRTGGHGYGDLLVPAVADTFRPAAPDWSGASVTYRLLLGDQVDFATGELFAHPPLVRVGL